MTSNEGKRDGELSRLVFRLPGALKTDVDHYAIDTCRSLNDSLIYLVKRGLAAEKAASGQPS
jgi:hypothetical protein